MNQRLIDFYTGAGIDDHGRTFEEILLWDSDELESVHDYVQWLFPTDQPSQFNPTAPILDQETLEAFIDSALCMKNLVRATDRILDHFKFTKDRNGIRTIPGKKHCSYYSLKVKKPKLNKPWWIQKGDHNYLRFTRILRCLNLVGLNIYAEMIYQLLSEMHEVYGKDIGDETLKHWYCAAFENDLYCNKDPDNHIFHSLTSF